MITSINHLGSRIGGYRLVTEIASGPNSQVFLGKRMGPAGKEVTAAVKVFQPSKEVKQNRERFLNEAHVIQQLRHPRILPMLDAGVDRGIPFIVTEYAVGGSLRSLLQNTASQPLELDEALHSISQIAQAIQYAHYRNVLHSNLKPSNILFNLRGNALVSDFSLATLSTITQERPPTRCIYLAPEQFVGIVGPESDQYALGCLAYEMLTGHPPFEGQVQPPYKLEQLVPPSQHNPELPPYIDKAILTAMAKGLTQRHEGIQAFLNALCLAPTSTAPVPIIQPASRPLDVQGQTTVPTHHAPATSVVDSPSPQFPLQNVTVQQMPPPPPSTPAIADQKTLTPLPLAPDVADQKTLTPLPLASNVADQKTLTPLPPTPDSADRKTQAPTTPAGTEFTPIKAVVLLPFSPPQQPLPSPSPVKSVLPQLHTLPNLFASAKMVALRNGKSLSGRHRTRERALMLIAGALIVLSVSGLLLIFSASSQQANTSARTSHITSTAITSTTSIPRHIPTTGPTSASTAIPIQQITATPAPALLATPSPTPAPTPAPTPSPTSTPVPTNLLTINQTYLSPHNCRNQTIDYKCTVTLYLDPAATQDVSWNVSASGIYARFSKSSGTLAPGQFISINIYIYDSCRASGSVTFTASHMSASAKWGC